MSTIRRMSADVAEHRHVDETASRAPSGINHAATCLSAFLLLFGLAATTRAGDAQIGAVLPISTALCDSMRIHNVLTSEAPVDCARLSLVKFPFVDFEGRAHVDGEIVVMDVVADHVAQVFATFRDIRFPIAKARLMDHYEGNDDASMADNNTSAFNARRIVGGNSLSMHAYGLAIDINPIQNPYAKRTGERLTFKPPAGAEFANRLNNRPWKKVRAGMAESVVEIFANEGFLTWGGYWSDPIDYQHFQVSGNLVGELAHLPRAQARAAFEQYVERYRACRKAAPDESGRSKCIMSVDGGGKPGG
jgi:hypothetical protein